MKKYLHLILLILAVLLAAAGWFLLPDKVAAQFNFSGEVSSTLPKPLAVLLPVALTGIGLFWSRNGTDLEWKKSIAVSGIGVVILVFEIVINMIIA